MLILSVTSSLCSHQEFLGRLADKVDNLNDLQRQADDLGNAGYVSDPDGLKSQVTVGI